MGKNKNEQQKSEQESISSESETEKVQETASAEVTPANTDEITEAIEITAEKPDETENVQEVALAETTPADTDEITEAIEIDIPIPPDDDIPEAPSVIKEGLKSIEAWAAELRIPTWQVAALKQSKKYAEGKAVSQADFEAGIKAAINKPQRG